MQSIAENSISLPYFHFHPASQRREGFSFLLESGWHHWNLVTAMCSVPHTFTHQPRAPSSRQAGDSACREGAPTSQVPQKVLEMEDKCQVSPHDSSPGKRKKEHRVLMICSAWSWPSLLAMILHGREVGLLLPLFSLFRDYKTRATFICLLPIKSPLSTRQSVLHP